MTLPLWLPSSIQSEAGSFVCLKNASQPNCKTLAMPQKKLFPKQTGNGDSSANIDFDWRMSTMGPRRALYAHQTTQLLGVATASHFNRTSVYNEQSLGIRHIQIAFSISAQRLRNYVCAHPSIIEYRSVYLQSSRDTVCGHVRVYHHTARASSHVKS